MAAGRWISDCLVLLLITTTMALDQNEGSTCTIKFLTQPPEIIPCNPYNNVESRNNLRLQCDIAVPRSIRNDIDISWYRMLDGEPVAENALRRDNQVIKIRRRTTIDADEVALFESSLRLVNVTEEDVGSYWCQVEYEINNELTIHRPCTSTYLGSPDEYSHLTVCPDRTHFFTLGPVCVLPQNDCNASIKSVDSISETNTSSNNSIDNNISSQVTNSPSPMPIQPSSTHEVSVSIPTTTVRVNTSQELISWFFSITISVILLFILLVLGVLTAVLISVIATRNKLRKKQARNDFISAPSEMHLSRSQHPRTDTSLSLPDIVTPPHHLPCDLQLTRDSIYEVPNRPLSLVENRCISASVTDSAYGDSQEVNKPDQDVTAIERDGNFYQIIAKSPSASVKEVTVTYTVPNMVKQRAGTGTSMISDDMVHSSESEEHAYENTIQPRYAPLCADTQDIPRIYSLPSSRKCFVGNAHLPTTTSSEYVTSSINVPIK